MPDSRREEGCRVDVGSLAAWGEGGAAKAHSRSVCTGGKPVDTVSAVIVEGIVKHTTAEVASRVYVSPALGMTVLGNIPGGTGIGGRRFALQGMVLGTCVPLAQGSCATALTLNHA